MDLVVLCRPMHHVLEKQVEGRHWVVLGIRARSEGHVLRKVFGHQIQESQGHQGLQVKRMGFQCGTGNIISIFRLFEAIDDLPVPSYPSFPP